MIKYNSNRNEVITGDEEGKIIIFSLKTGQSVCIKLILILDSFQAHSNPITQMDFIVKRNILITGAKDKTIKMWKFPENWNSKEIEKFEENELLKETALMNKINNKLTNDIFDDSFDEELNGWDL